MENPGWWITPAVIAGLAVLGGLAKWIHWMGETNEHKNGVGKVLDEIRDDIKKILLRLPPIPAVDGSPRRLTDYGERIRDEVGANVWASREAALLRNSTKGKEPYEVEEISVSHARRVSLTPEMRRAAYEKRILS